MTKRAEIELLSVAKEAEVNAFRNEIRVCQNAVETMITESLKL